MFNFHSIYFQILPNQSAYSILLFQRKCKFKMKRNQLKALCLFIVAAYYIHNTEAALCSPYTGPSGAKQCIKLSSYNDYQWATCHTDSYIKVKTGGSHHCANRFNTYCLYQCMLDKYGKSFGDVYSSCRCNSASQKEKYTLVFFVVVAISSLLVS